MANAVFNFRLKLKKIGKITRPFRYDLNQSPCDCTVEVSKRFKGLDLVNRVQEVHRSITMNKASGDDGIPAELVQILKDDAIKVVLTQYVSEFGKLSSGHRTGKGIFIPIPKKGNGKEWSNYLTFVLIPHASKVMLKILQARFQQYMN